MNKVKFNKVAALALMLAMLAVSAPAALASGSYLGANGQSYQNDDFWYDDFDVTVSQSDGKATFCWEHPDTYFEGYDIFTARGSFVGGLANYQPKTLSKNINCYTYPKQFATDTKVVAQVYPYIELADGARKYIQPGARVIAPVRAVDEDNVWLDAPVISGTSTTNSVNVFWWDGEEGNAATDTKYKVMFKKGYHYSMPSSAGESFVSFNYFKLTGLSAGESWTFQVVPVKLENGKYVEIGSRSNLLHVGTLAEDDAGVGAMHLRIDSWNNKIMPEISWSEFTARDFDAYLVTVRKGTSWKDSKAVVYHYPDKTDTSLQLGTLLKANESYLVQIAPYNAKNGLAYVIKGAESNVVRFETGAFSGDGSNVINPGSQASELVEVEKEDVTLSAPRLVKPKNNVVLTNYPRKAVLLWNKVQNASYYEVEVACDVCASTTTRWLSPTTYTTKRTSFMTPSLAGDNRFRFKVRAFAADGTAGAWSEYRYFRFDTSK